MSKIIVVLMLFVSFAYAEDKSCVSPEEAIKALEIAVLQIPNQYYGYITLECDPCKCPTDGMVGCYEYMASQERKREKQYKEVFGLLERVKKYGICRRD